jgi:hypothetical protein
VSSRAHCAEQYLSSRQGDARQPQKQFLLGDWGDWGDCMFEKVGCWKPSDARRRFLKNGRPKLQRPHTAASAWFCGFVGHRGATAMHVANSDSEPWVRTPGFTWQSRKRAARESRTIMARWSGVGREPRQLRSEKKIPSSAWPQPLHGLDIKNART